METKRASRSLQQLSTADLDAISGGQAVVRDTMQDGERRVGAVGGYHWGAVGALFDSMGMSGWRYCRSAEVGNSPQHLSPVPVNGRHVYGAPRQANNALADCYQHHLNGGR